METWTLLVTRIETTPHQKNTDADRSNRGYWYRCSIVDDRALSGHRRRLPSHSAPIIYNGPDTTRDVPEWVDLFLS